MAKDYRTRFCHVYQPEFKEKHFFERSHKQRQHKTYMSHIHESLKKPHQKGFPSGRGCLWKNHQTILRNLKV